ncbi:MAG: hypothetical protein KKE20_00835, partial [Nanoarchaeota archaeon]|nr:hypothetical protein [Nanoarchaeota archaeon]
FQEVNDKLQEKLIEMNKIRVMVGEVKDGIRKDKDVSNKMRLSEKQKMVEEKMKRGEKLTTEDIIAMQGMD